MSQAWPHSWVFLWTVTLLYSASTIADETPERAPTRAQQIPVVRAGTPPIIDGRLSEAVWKKAAVISELTQAEPEEGQAPTERTLVYLLYDDDSLYIGVRAFDSEPEKIIAKERQRDVTLDGDDSIAIAIDTFHDQRHGYYFQVNPLGTCRDGLIAQERDPDSFQPTYQADWDGIWYAGAVIDNEGWTAEIALPVKTLSFDPKNTTWGFNIQRTIARKRELDRWTAARRQVRVFSLGEAGELTGLSRLRQGLGVDVIPYTKAKIVHDSVTGRDGFEVKPGLDVFYKLTPSVTLGLTLNTDFAEAEVDERKVNLSRFPLFFPEKRAFFLQDANYFKYGGIQQSPLPFFSRKIGLSDTGEPIDLIGGLKATGRTGPVTFGLFDVQTDALRDLHAKNLAVGRATLDLGKESTVGAIFTHGDPLHNRDNTLGGMDFNYKNSNLFGTHQVVEANGYFMHSDTEGEAGNAFGGRLLYPNFDWEGTFVFDQIGERFNPALGFISQTGAREYSGWIGHRWCPGFLDSFYAEVYGRSRTKLDNALIDRELWLPNLIVQTKDRDTVQFAPILWREQFFEPFELVPGVIVAPGEYSYRRYLIFLEASNKRALSGNAEVIFGDYLNGTRTDFNSKVTWRPTSWFNLSGAYTQNAITLPQGDFTVHVTQVALNFTFTPNLAWNLIGQYDNVTNEVGLNSRLRWTLKPGSDVFLVFNQGADTSRDHFRWLKSDLSAKIAWTFRF